MPSSVLLQQLVHIHAIKSSPCAQTWPHLICTEACLLRTGCTHSCSCSCRPATMFIQAARTPVTHQARSHKHLCECQGESYSIVTVGKSPALQLSTGCGLRVVAAKPSDKVCVKVHGWGEVVAVACVVHHSYMGTLIHHLCNV